MKAVILAAGKGTRMRPLTLETPKPMIEILGQPLLHHIIDSLPKEITELILVVGYKQEKIKDYFTNEFEGKKITYITQTERKGTGHALALCKDLFSKDERFLLMVGDDLHSPEALERLVSHPLALLVHEHEDPSRFGVIEADENDKALTFIEKPKNPTSNLVWPGVAVLDTRVFDYKLPLHDLGEYFVTDQVNKFMQEFDFVVERSKLWHPIGYPHELDKAEEILSKGDEIENPYSDLPVIILAGGRGTRLPEEERDKPKSMVDVAGKPILQHQLELLEEQGIKNITLALGYKSEVIIDWLSENNYEWVKYVIEDEPLGTGGALKFASKNFQGPFLSLFGDILGDFNFKAIVRASCDGKYRVLAGAHFEDVAGFGVIECDKDRKICSFLEKQAGGICGVVNANASYLHTDDFKDTPEKFSIEYDLYPQLVKEGRLVIHEHKGGYWFDCGTPERLQAVRELFKNAHD